MKLRQVSPKRARTLRKRGEDVRWSREVNSYIWTQNKNQEKVLSFSLPPADFGLGNSYLSQEDKLKTLDRAYSKWSK